MHLIVDITISPEEYLKWYQGAARSVVARSRDGRRVSFPAECLRPYVSHGGIQGSFAIYFDDNNKLLGVEKLR
ncbi:DUF2835 domain-containing protein [Ketobacter sp.]|uniref:DUF2835 domain-containing protein n=1 Tax=Ketobacter sp. TaxID=2083498 RepID=UPI000F2CDFAB|nr:DUF2835 domain-containing protein [Ketobacter sp.]RLT93506.1 MAG: DUF2835 family protein [Ketobacter sp.]